MRSTWSFEERALRRIYAAGRYAKHEKYCRDPDLLPPRMLRGSVLWVHCGEKLKFVAVSPVCWLLNCTARNSPPNFNVCFVRFFVKLL